MVSVAFAKDQNNFVSASQNGTIRVRPINQESPCRGHLYAVTSVAVVGNCVVSGSLDKTVLVWDIRNSTQPVYKIEEKKIIN